ncbi:MAG: hypothetical protein U1F43_23255 [Myxococcota bacterium]
MSTPMLVHATFLATALATFLAAPLHALADPPTGDAPTLPESDANPGATRAQAIEAYVKDCHATLKATAFTYEEESKVDECKALNVDQNCNPDTFGCDAELDTCQHACQPVCGKCQDTCAGSCDDCKGKCAAGDTACVRKCAEVRADCRGRCMNGLRQCQGRECGQASEQCMATNTQRLKSCDAAKCDAYLACVDAQDDYEAARKTCRAKANGVDDFCQHVCDMEHGIPTYYFDEGMAPTPAPVEDAASLAKQCTAAAQCPTDYVRVEPYLASFCAGATSDASLEVLAAEVARGAISKRTLGLVFNAYGAMHGYEFKKETWMNGFFYGAGAGWLPASCRAKMKTVASAKVMPLRMTMLRDKVKKVWNAAK